MKSTDTAGSETLFQKRCFSPWEGHRWEAGEGGSRAESEPYIGPAPPLTAFVTLGWSLNLAKPQFF